MYVLSLLVCSCFIGFKGWVWPAQDSRFARRVVPVHVIWCHEFLFREARCQLPSMIFAVAWTSFSRKRPGTSNVFQHKDGLWKGLVFNGATDGLPRGKRLRLYTRKPAQLYPRKLVFLSRAVGDSVWVLTVSMVSIVSMVSTGSMVSMVSAAMVFHGSDGFHGFHGFYDFYMFLWFLWFLCFPWFIWFLLPRPWLYDAMVQKQLAGLHFSYGLEAVSGAQWNTSKFLRMHLSRFQRAETLCFFCA